MTNKILITGATGFIGSHLVRMYLSRTTIDSQGQNLLVLPVRDVEAAKAKLGESEALQFVELKQISSNTDWQMLLEGVDVVIHCAANAQALGSDSSDDDFDEINTHAAIHLGRSAEAAGVSQFVFLSSIKARDAKDRYGRSKLLAEQGLQLECNRMALTIVRPCMVYGPGGKGTFTALSKAMTKHFPLPLGGINNNRRSVLFVDNLVDFVQHVIVNRQPGVFEIANAEPISTTALAREIKQALDSRTWLIPVPATMIDWLGRVTGKQEVTERLTGDMLVDITSLQQVCNWRPKYTTVESIKLAMIKITQQGLSRD